MHTTAQPESNPEPQDLLLHDGGVSNRKRGRTVEKSLRTGHIKHATSLDTANSEATVSPSSLTTTPSPLGSHRKMSEVRRRGTAAGSKAPSSAPPASTEPKPKSANSFTVTDVLRILGGLLLLNCALSYLVTRESVAWGYRPWYSKPRALAAYLRGPLELTDAELGAFDGSDAGKPVYIALNGTIYDVSAGRHIYGPGGSYNFFAGRDATRAFITGCFQEDLTPDVRGAEYTYVPVDEEEGADGELKRAGGRKGVTKAELKVRKEREVRLARKRVRDTIDGWSKMFKGESGKNYFEVGKVRRESGWLEKLPRRELCEQAQKQRPKRTD